MENKTTNRAKMFNKRCIKARLQYLQRGYEASEATSQATCFALLFVAGLLLLHTFCLNNKIHFSLANANNSASFKRKTIWKWRFLRTHKQQTNLWMNLPTIQPGLVIYNWLPSLSFNRVYVNNINTRTSTMNLKLPKANINWRKLTIALRRGCKWMEPTTEPT